MGRTHKTELGVHSFYSYHKFTTCLDVVEIEVYTCICREGGWEVHEKLRLVGNLRERPLFNLIHLASKLSVQGRSTRSLHTKCVVGS